MKPTLLILIVICCAPGCKTGQRSEVTGESRVSNSISPRTSPLAPQNTNRVQVCTSSILRNGTNYQTFASVLETAAANIVNVTITNPPPAPLLHVQIGCNLQTTWLVMSNLDDPGTPTVFDGTFIASALTSDLGPQTFFRAPSIGGVQSVLLTWDASPDQRVLGYNIYSGTESRLNPDGTEKQPGLWGAYGPRIGAVQYYNALEFVVTNLPPGSTNYFAATATGVDDIESDYSNEVAYTVPPFEPQPTIKLIR